jgi:hypothetical protein
VEVRVGRKQQVQYPGELVKPIPFDTSATGAKLDAEWRRVQQERKRRLKMLADFWQVKLPDQATQLAVWLAIAHVPGFQIVARPGRKREWTAGKLVSLYCTVLEIKRTRGLTDKSACNFIANNPEYAGTWGPPAEHKGTAKSWARTLESRYHDAKRPIELGKALMKKMSARTKRRRSSQ